MTRECKGVPATMLGLLRGFRSQTRGRVLSPISVSADQEGPTEYGNSDAVSALRRFSAGSHGTAAYGVGGQGSKVGGASIRSLLPHHQDLHSLQGIAQGSVKGYIQGSQCLAPHMRGFTASSAAQQSQAQAARVRHLQGQNQEEGPRHVQPTAPLSSVGKTQADSQGRAPSAGESGSAQWEGSGSRGDDGNGHPRTAREAGVLMKAAIRRGDFGAVHAAFDPSLPVRDPKCV